MAAETWGGFCGMGMEGQRTRFKQSNYLPKRATLTLHPRVET